MIVLAIVLVLLFLLLILPVGVDASFDASGPAVKLKIWAFRFTVLPSKKRKEQKEQKPKKKKSGKTSAEDGKQPKKKLQKDDILGLIRIGLKALNRFRIHLCINLFALEWIAASADPFDAVLQYGRINAALCALQGPMHSVFHFKKEQIRTDMDLNLEKPAISARLVATIRIWEVLMIGICAGLAFLVWNRNRKKRSGADETPCTDVKGT